MPAETQTRSYPLVDQERLIALVKEYALRVRDMTDRMAFLQTQIAVAMICASVSAIGIGLSVAWAGSESSSSIQIAAFGVFSAVLFAVSLVVWRSSSSRQGAARRNLNVYVTQLERITQRASELQDHAAFEQRDAYLELELAILDGESSLRLARDLTRR